MNQGLKRELALLGGLASAGLCLFGKKNLGTALGIGCAALALLPGKTYSFQGKTALITGGSRGLGLALARNLLEQGAQVAILARDEAELERAKVQLLEFGNVGQILAIRCDVTNRETLEHAFSKVITTFGQIDVLINCAGSIAVGPFETMEKTDFDLQLDLQLRAVIDSIELVMPEFRKAGGGRIANICSIGGMIPVPHMSTYCAAKFAMAGLSETLAAELAVDRVQVTTVYPGLMRTGSPIQAVFKGDCEKEYAWFAAGDVTPGLSVSADTAAKHILNGIRQGSARVTYPLITKIGILGHAALPETYALLMRTAARMMPQSNNRQRKTGAECQGLLNRQFWYKPLLGVEERAEQELNQHKKYDAEYNLGLLNT